MLPKQLIRQKYAFATLARPESTKLKENFSAAAEGQTPMLHTDLIPPRCRCRGCRRLAKKSTFCNSEEFLGRICRHLRTKCQRKPNLEVEP